MQGFLSGYALWVGRRRRRLGHLFQGRYRAEMIEDESYYWTVSRYIHLNPVRAGLVARPEQWEWSSYPGYRTPQRRQAWVAHDALLAAWRGDHGGKDAAAAYVRFVEAGLTEPPASPFREAFGGWILGSERFLDQLRTRVGPVLSNPPAPEALQLAGLDPERIFAAVAEFYGVDRSSLSRRHDPHLARPVAAWLCRRHTEAPHRLLAERLGLSRADSVPNLTRRLDARLKNSPPDWPKSWNRTWPKSGRRPSGRRPRSLAAARGRSQLRQGKGQCPKNKEQNLTSRQPGGVEANYAKEKGSARRTRNKISCIGLVNIVAWYRLVKRFHYSLAGPEALSSEDLLGGSSWDGSVKGPHPRCPNETANSPVI